ncbi:hypothetical protein [Bacillus weihaiensis]|uniref:hypothetical protein n=1 Tax=Bacillus weihaiensis TaxID=1547283 RepID=UPI0023578C51|nr:hypothetical protein [Bacillus weihaiensis]
MANKVALLNLYLGNGQQFDLGDNPYVQLNDKDYTYQLVHCIVKFRVSILYIL